MFKLKIFPMPALRRPLCSKFWYSSYTSYQNHYEVLGISKQSTNDEIKQAYYEQSKLYHPDRREGNQDRFREISSAYEVLGNPRLRKMYDRGLISSNTPIYPSPEHPIESETPTDKTASQSAPMSNIDQWSKEQCSQTFARDQLRRNQQRMKARIKHQKQDTFALQSVFWLFGSVVLGIGIYLERLRHTDRKPDTRN